MPDNPPVPIVFLPGVMGSRLYFPSSRKYWDPDHRGRMLGWFPVRFFRTPDHLRQQLHVREPAGVMIDHEQPPGEIDAGARDRGWGGAAWGFYGPLLKDLQALAPTYAVGYDWRQGISRLGGHLRAKLGQVLDLEGARELILITHSMGGLVARAALAQDPTLAGRVRGVLHVCQPAHGAVVLYRRFFTGVDPRYDVEASLSDKVFRLILGGNALDFTGNMSGLPGPMQLLPGPHFPAGPAGPWNAWLGANPDGTPYDQSEYPPGLVLPGLAAAVRADLRARIIEVRQFHQQLGGAGHPQTWAIYGVGLPTDIGIAFDPDQGPVPARSTDGDGTVPSVSGAGLFGRPGVPFHPSLDLDEHRLFVVPNLSHAEACTHPTVRDVAVRIATRLLGPDRTGPAPVERLLPTFAFAAAGGRAADAPETSTPVKDITGDLVAALQGFVRRLGEVVDEAAVLEVATYVSDRMDAVTSENGRLNGAELRALTRISLDGNTQNCLPLIDGKVDDAVWRPHLETVARAQVHRAEMLKATVDATRAILETLKLV